MKVLMAALMFLPILAVNVPVGTSDHITIQESERDQCLLKLSKNLPLSWKDVSVVRRTYCSRRPEHTHQQSQPSATLALLPLLDGLCEHCSHIHMTTHTVVTCAYSHILKPCAHTHTHTSHVHIPTTHTL